MPQLNIFGGESTEHDPFDPHLGWRSGIGAGLVAAIAMGVGIMVVEPTLLRDQIAGMYGAPGSLAVGWLVHMVHGAVFGLAFSVVIADPSLANVGHRYPGSIVAGVIYGLFLAVVGMGIVMPMWLDVIGLSSPSLPFIDASLIVWHLLFGIVLGAVFPLLDDW